MSFDDFDEISLFDLNPIWFIVDWNCKILNEFDLNEIKLIGDVNRNLMIFIEIIDWILRILRWIEATLTGI